ncbi:MAG: transglycosylase SLT domain-containing protein [Chitinivibrionales bacterium]|nr:transglycosylase SLT domain-containing protein [Chitinivibrionales bacterium]MBD3358707.1 transglycosylase SLT domain-containing protein [Chitinivibrionales bacterium]
MKISTQADPRTASAGTATPYGDPRVVAREFASMFNSMLVRSMRGTVPENSLIPTGMGEKIYTDMLDTEYAKLLTDQGSLGLVDLILEQIRGKRDQTEALRELQSLKQSSWSGNPHPSTNSLSAGTDDLSVRLARWESIIAEAGARYNVDTNLIKAVVSQESAGDPYAVSHAGAKGLMQLIDSTAEAMGVGNVFNPRDNVMGGVRYLRLMLNRFRGDVSKALASYNAGPGAVDRYNGIPPYPETQDYVRKVLAKRDAFTENAQRTMGQDISTRK